MAKPGPPLRQIADIQLDSTAGTAGDPLVAHWLGSAVVEGQLDVLAGPMGGDGDGMAAPGAVEDDRVHVGWIPPMVSRRSRCCRTALSLPSPRTSGARLNSEACETTLMTIRDRLIPSLQMLFRIK